jgi:hypothetical protein
MSDNTTANAGTGGDTFAAKDIAGVKYPRNILTTPAGTDITPLAEGGSVTVSNFPSNLTDTQLRASAVPVSIAATVTTTATVANFPASQAVTGTFWQATQPVSIAGTVAVSNASLPLPTGAATEATLAARIPVNGQALMAASVPVVIASNQSAFAVTTSGTVTNVLNTAQGAALFHHAISAATTNATSVKAAIGTINAIVLTNSSAAIKYFKLYNKASAPTVGTDTPAATIGVPATGTVVFPCGAFGMRCNVGIAYAITGAIAVADTTAVAAGDMAVHIQYL